MSRLVFDPPMGAELSALSWTDVFPFQEREGRRCESLVWRRYAPHDPCVHALGCLQQEDRHAAGRTSNYVGCISASAEEIRSSDTVPGVTFIVYHAPSEGIHHAHIELRLDDGVKLTKPLKKEVRFAAERIFGARSDHRCAQKLPT